MSDNAETVLAVLPTNIDWNLLAQQKAWLAEIPEALDPQGFTDGLLTFIDAIQDAYAVRLGEATVFPHLQQDDGTSEFDMIDRGRDGQADI